MIKFIRSLFVASLCILYIPILDSKPEYTPITSEQRSVVDKAIEKIAGKVDKKVPVTSVLNSPVPGILQVTSDLNVFYVTNDGKYAFFGDLISIDNDVKQWSITEGTMRKLRAKALANISTNDMIIYPATAKKIAVVYVFTDIDCPYCHKMQEHIKEYTDLGIEIRYLSFPRAGLKSKSFEEAVKVWCAKDKAQAYAKAIEDKEFPEATCSTNPVSAQFELGQQMGISGTPTIILENGVKVPGLVEPKILAKIIKENIN